MGFIKHQVSSTHNTHTPFLLSTAKARRTSCTEIHSFFPHRYVVLRCFAARRMTLMTGGARNWTSILYHILSPIVCVISVKEEEVRGGGRTRMMCFKVNYIRFLVYSLPMLPIHIPLPTTLFPMGIVIIIESRKELERAGQCGKVVGVGVGGGVRITSHTKAARFMERGKLPGGLIERCLIYDSKLVIETWEYFVSFGHSDIILWHAFGQLL